MNTTVLAVAIGAVAVTAIALMNKKKPATSVRGSVDLSKLRATSPGQPTFVYTGQFQPITPPQQSHPGQY